MLRGLKLATVAVCVLASAGLAGCADTVYPRLPDLGGIGSTLLTPTEQKKAISDLAAEQKNAGTQAPEEAERRN